MKRPMGFAQTGDMVELPYLLTTGTVSVLRQENEPELVGLFLPDGTFKPIDPEPQRWIGF